MKELSPGRDLTRSWALMEQLKDEQAESREREREISPVPGLSRGRDKTMERQSRSDKFLDSHGTDTNIKELSLGTAREISPVP